MDALDLLTADHNRVRGLFARFRQAREANDQAALTSIAGTLFEELRVHSAIEESSFYPSVRETDQGLADIVLEGIEEHHVVDQLMAEAERLQPTDPAWVAKVTVLIENVEHHAAEEESEMFPQVRARTDAGTRQRWGARLERAKADLGAPTSAEAATLTVGQLRRLATEQQIPGRSTMSREELAATVNPR